MKRLLAYLFLVLGLGIIFNTFLLAETFQLTKCYTVETNALRKDGGVAFKAFLPSKQFRKDKLSKNQYYVDTESNKIEYNYRYTDTFFKILKEDHDKWLEGIPDDQAKKLMKNFRATQEGSRTYSLTKFDKSNNQIIYQLRFEDSFYGKNKKKYKKKLIGIARSWHDVYTRKTIDLNTGQVVTETENFSGRVKSVLQCESSIKPTDVSYAEKLENLDPSKIKSKTFDNKIALIIGIEKYSDAPDAQFANLDAKQFSGYASNAFGIKKQNINMLIDNNATNAQIQKSLQIWLKSKVKSGKSDLIIFFSGHGLALLESKELYLIPHDGIPDVLESTSLSRTKLFKRISDLKPKSVTIFLDTCYSGVTRDKKMLLEGSRPLMILPLQNQNNIPDNFTVFSASKLNQISSGLKGAKHGIFSYYLMKGLEGKADSNKDKKITNGELLAYMDENVSQKAAELGRQQNPSLAGDPDQVLMRYR